MRKPTEPLIRFIAKVSVDIVTGCWNWTGWRDKDGYGFLSAGSGKGLVRAHRWAYEFFNEKKIEHEIDHNCNNPSCVNPKHLSDIPHRANILRSEKAPPAIHARKKLCPRGHELVLREKVGSSGARRWCPQCEAIGHQERKARRAAERSA